MFVSMLASLIDVNRLVTDFGYPLMLLAVMAESSGVPIPGETALITAAVLSSQGKLQIELVIPLAAIGAIVGDNIGYQIGRHGGRWLLERPGRFQGRRLQALDSGEAFFDRHGPKAVFLGRFVLGLRVWASWLAGATHMPWRSFFLWNALGGICWATAVGLIAYFLGDAAGSAISAFGIYGLVAVAIAAGGGWLAHRRHRRRTEVTHEPSAGVGEPAAAGESSAPARDPSSAMHEPSTGTHEPQRQRGV